MHRVTAILLACLFSFLLIGPSVLAAPGSPLPACCRKDGKHHCSMKSMESTASHSGPGVIAASDKCPFYPKADLVPTSGDAHAAAPASIFFASILSHPAIHAQTEAQYRLSFARAWQKRGPPALLS